MSEADRIDSLVGQWKGERPDLDLETMALAARVMRAGQLLDEGVTRLAAEHGVSRAEGDVLFALRRSGGRLSPSRLSASLLVTSGTMTNRLDRLERRELIERIPNPDDRRSLEVALTPAALKLVDEAVGRHVANEAEMLSGLSQRERDQLDGLLRKLISHLEPPGA